MLDRLPVILDPLNLAEKGSRLKGSLEISEFLRLSTELFDHSGRVDVSLSFDKEGGLSVIRGEVKANLILECQACLEKLLFPIENQFKLALLKSLDQAQAGELAGDCEPLILESDKISLNNLIEDELLLALPDFPRHQHDCYEKAETFAIADGSNEPMASDNPFSVLAKLKNTGD